MSRAQSFLAFAVLAASIGAPSYAASPDNGAERRAQAALQALSERYAQRWAALPASEKPTFSSRERAWLNHDRWVEHRACVAQRGEAAAAECLAEVVERRLAAL